MLTSTFLPPGLPRANPAPHRDLSPPSAARARALPHPRMSLPLPPPSSRRVLLRRLAVLPALPVLPAAAAPSAAAVLGARLEAAAPPRPRADASTTRRDVRYPPSFRGTWAVSSRTAAVDAPGGDALFGRAGALEDARAAVGRAPLEYAARFVAGAYADRVYNVHSIAAAGMGGGSVLECAVEGANVVRVAVRPVEAGGEVFEVRMEVLRREWGEGDGAFWVSEVVRQSVRRAAGGGVQVKDVETVCKFVVEDGERMTGRQRTLVYVLRGDPRDKAAAGRPVDARTYELVYTRRR